MAAERLAVPEAEGNVWPVERRELAQRLAALTQSTLTGCVAVRRAITTAFGEKERVGNHRYTGRLEVRTDFRSIGAALKFVMDFADMFNRDLVAV